MNSSPSTALSLATDSPSALSVAIAATDSDVVLAREAGVAFWPPLSTVDPFVEWLSLMEVVQMLCPDWPVRSRSLPGKVWKL